MQLFIELKKHFKTLGIEPNQKHLFDKENVIALIIFVYCFVAMVIFFLFEPNKAFVDLGNVFFGFVSFGLNGSTLLSNVIKQEKIFNLIKNLEETIKNRYNHHTFKSFNYNQVSKKVEKWTKIAYVAFVKVSWPLMYVPQLIISYYEFFTGQGRDAFVLSVPMSSPFDWKTPFGYLFTCSVQIIGWFFLLINCTCILSFLSGACWVLTSFVEDIEEDVNHLKNIESNRMTYKKKFFDIIKFHSIAKQFVYDFSYIYEIHITGYYLWSLLSISSTLLVIRAEMSLNGSPVDILISALLIFWAFIQMFIFCDLAEDMTTRYGQIDTLIYCCDWYTFPQEIQKILPIVMMAAQEPVVLQGFANLKCTREAFKKVVQGGFSYFMTLQQFAH